MLMEQGKTQKETVSIRKSLTMFKENINNETAAEGKLRMSGHNQQKEDLIAQFDLTERKKWEDEYFKFNREQDGDKEDSFKALSSCETIVPRPKILH